MIDRHEAHPGHSSHIHAETRIAWVVPQRSPQKPSYSLPFLRWIHRM